MIKRINEPFVLGMNIGAMLEEKLDDGDAVVTRSEVKRSRMASVEVAHVHQMRLNRQDTAHRLHVARLGRLEQLLLRIQAGSGRVLCKGRSLIKCVPAEKLRCFPPIRESFSK